jgi:hypothetical protein
VTSPAARKRDTSVVSRGEITCAAQRDAAVRERLTGVVGGQVLEQERHAAEATVGSSPPFASSRHGRTSGSPPLEVTVEPFDAGSGFASSIGFPPRNEFGLGSGVEPLVSSARAHAESPSTPIDSGRRQVIVRTVWIS